MAVTIDLGGRNALVTGGGRGIGRGISLLLAQAGANVAINYARTPDAANATAEEIRALGRRAETYQADVSDFAQCEAMAQRVLADFGHIDILVNNAGIASRGNSVVDTDPAELERVIATHTYGAFYVSKLIVPQMRALGRGDVVMISSGAAQSFGARGAPYNMGKAGMEAVAYTLAHEERQHGIRVNVVAPGLVESDMGFRLMRANAGIKDMRELDARMPFGHVCQPEDIASAVLYFVSEGGRYVTNQRMTVNGGGFSRRPP
jgi:3-oxoacyl-[acyl-carrier protein] reductase